MKTPTENDDALWDARDVAHFLKVSRSWVYHKAESGELPSLRIGGGLLRFDPDAIRAFARGESTTSATPKSLPPRRPLLRQVSRG